MKTKLLLTFALLLGLNFYNSAQTASTASDAKFPYVEVVVTQERIWLMVDERPVDALPVKLINADGETVLHQLFCTQTADWSIDVTKLPSGKYKILIGNNQTEYLDKQSRRRTL